MDWKKTITIVLTIVLTIFVVSFAVSVVYNVLNKNCDYVYNKQCVENCPDDVYIYEENKHCLSSCSNYLYTDEVNKKCFKTCPTGIYTDEVNKKCVESCPTGIYTDEVNKKCVESCPTGIYTDEVNKKCLSSCAEGKYGIPGTFNCIDNPADCPDETPYGNRQTRMCVKLQDCNDGYYGDDENNLCSTATECYDNNDPKKFGNDATKKCESDCPEGTVGIVSSTISSRGKCRENCLDGQYAIRYDTRRCSYICPKPYYKNENSKECLEIEDCPGELSYTYSLGYYGECLPVGQFSCPDGTYYEDLRTEYPDINVKYNCVDRSCKAETITNKKKNYEGQFGKQCVETCPQGTAEYTLTNIDYCVTTCPGNLYKYTDPNTNISQCVETCPGDFYGENIQKTCVEALQCPNGLPANILTKKCEDCDNGYTVNSDTNICEIQNNCGTGIFFDYISNTCITDPSNCSDGYYADDSKMLCVLPDRCSDSTPYANLQTKKCVEDCPTGLFGDITTHTCVVVEDCPTETPYGNYYTNTCSENCETTTVSPGHYDNIDNGKLCITKEQCIEKDGRVPFVPYLPENVPFPKEYNCASNCPEGWLWQGQDYGEGYYCIEINDCSNDAGTPLDGSQQNFQIKEIDGDGDLCLTSVYDFDTKKHSTSVCGKYFPDTYRYNDPNEITVDGNQKYFSYCYTPDECFANGTYAHDGTNMCYPPDNCPDGTFADNQTKKCISCSGATPYRYNNSCVDECPDEYTANDTTNTCDPI